MTRKLRKSSATKYARRIGAYAIPAARSGSRLHPARRRARVFDVTAAGPALAARTVAASRVEASLPHQEGPLDEAVGERGERDAAGAQHHDDRERERGPPRSEEHMSELKSHSSIL